MEESKIQKDDGIYVDKRSQGDFEVSRDIQLTHGVIERTLKKWEWVDRIDTNGTGIHG